MSADNEKTPRSQKTPPPPVEEEWDTELTSQKLEPGKEDVVISKVVETEIDIKEKETDDKDVNLTTEDT